MKDWGCFWVGLILPPLLILRASKVFWISKVMALSTLPEDIFLWDFCKWSLSELLLSPAFFPHMGHTFIVGLLCCHSIEAFPCSLLSKSSRVFAKPSFGCARLCTFFNLFHACNNVSPLKVTNKHIILCNCYLLLLVLQGGKMLFTFSTSSKREQLWHSCFSLQNNAPRLSLPCTQHSQWNQKPLQRDQQCLHLHYR